MTADIGLSHWLLWRRYVHLKHLITDRVILAETCYSIAQFRNW